MPPERVLRQKEVRGASERIRANLEKILGNEKERPLFEQYLNSLTDSQDMVQEIYRAHAARMMFTPDQAGFLNQCMKEFRSRMALGREAQTFFKPEEIAKKAQENKQWKEAFENNPEAAKELYDHLPMLAIDNPDRLRAILFEWRTAQKEGGQAEMNFFQQMLSDFAKGELTWAKGIAGALFRGATGIGFKSLESDRKKKETKKENEESEEEQEKRRQHEAELEKYRNDPQEFFDAIARHIRDENYHEVERLVNTYLKLYISRDSKLKKAKDTLKKPIKSKDGEKVLDQLQEALGAENIEVARP